MAASCDPSTLANQARCFFSCTHGPVGQSLKSYLLCQAANSSLVAGASHILTEGGDFINTEAGDRLITES